jgi:hypothetical protein
MAAAIRAFVTGMKFPTTKSHSQTNSILATFTISMLQFALGIADGCTEVSVSPAVSQVGEIIHGSERTVNRRLRALRNLGLLTQTERGHFSTIYTFHQNPVATPTGDIAAATPTDGTARKRQRRQVPRPATPSIVPATPSPAPATPTGAPLWSKASGSSLENKPLEKEAVESKSGSFSDSNQTMKLPDGFVWQNGKAVYVGEAL